MMKTTTSLKSKPKTPKTPGGISKSLLTPCRRVGLSRNWRKSDASPFNSPLATAETKQNQVETRKRKETSPERIVDSQELRCEDESGDVGTPARKLDLPRRKKSKMLLNSITSTNEDDISQLSPRTEKTKANNVESKSIDVDEEAVPKEVSSPVRLKSKSKVKESDSNKAGNGEGKNSSVSTPMRLKSKSKSRKISPKSSKIKDDDTNPEPKEDAIVEMENVVRSKTEIKNENKTDLTEADNSETESKNKRKKDKSPNNLTKECIIVLQKKIFKKELQEKGITKHVSQILFEDSDSDDVPLNCLNKPVATEAVDIMTVDDDFAITSKQKPHKTSHKIVKNKNLKTKMAMTKIADNKTVFQVHNPSQSSIDDEGDFFEKKQTIVVRKTYDKVIKPSKAKSTGSITTKDIEDLKERIEAKKKMLLAKSMTDTKELRELIKKWQKGCQDALIELMDLMRTKCPDSEAMEYSKILQTLKIPSTLVGYDSDNDCFVTPDDDNIILSHV